MEEIMEKSEQGMEAYRVAIEEVEEVLSALKERGAEDAADGMGMAIDMVAELGLDVSELEGARDMLKEAAGLIDCAESMLEKVVYELQEECETDEEKAARLAELRKVIAELRVAPEGASKGDEGETA